MHELLDEEKYRWGQDKREYFQQPGQGVMTEPTSIFPRWAKPRDPDMPGGRPEPS
jgi:two-component SAPR family response regulator